MNTTKAALLGSAVTFAALLLISASPLPQLLRVGIANEVQVGLNPHPRDAVRIYEGAPYTVPTGKVLLLKALGTAITASGSQNSYLRIDGAQELYNRTDYSQTGPGTWSLVQPIADGLVAHEGQVVEVNAGGAPGNVARAWGYLVDA